MLPLQFVTIPDQMFPTFQVLSMSRLGGASAVAPLVASMPSEVLILCDMIFHFEK
jgi:hypothetical protein